MSDDDDISHTLSALDAVLIEDLFADAGPAPVEDDQHAATDVALIAAWADSHGYRVIFSDDDTIAFKVEGTPIQIGLDHDDPQYRFVSTPIKPMSDDSSGIAGLRAATWVNTDSKAVKIIAPSRTWTATVERVDDTLAAFLSALPRILPQLVRARGRFLSISRHIRDDSERTTD